MTRYTVVTAAGVQTDLARTWLDATDRAAVARASNTIDGMLREDAPQKGEDTGNGLRQIIVSPLIATFSVNDNDRIVTIWSMKHVGAVTNGH